MPRPVPSESRAALDVIEEAVHLLRATPPADYLVWFAGTGPFAAALLFFGADMSRGAFAETRLPSASLGLAMLFLWARTCQAMFARRLHARLAGAAAAPAGFRGWAGVFISQAAWQPLALLLLPAALLLVVPFPWFLAAQQSLLAVAHRAGGRPGRALSLAVRQATLLPHQNSQLVSLLALVWLAALINVGVALYGLPQLAKLLLGVESSFTLSPWAMANTTFLAAALVVATLLVDPLAKAVYVLRCSHGASLATGEDLLAQLRLARPAVLPLALALLLSPLTAVPGLAAEPAPPAGEISAPRLNRAIDEVLRRPEFAWRSPREQAEADTKPEARSRFERLLEQVQKMMAGLFQRLEQPLQDFFDWLGRQLSGRTRTPPVAPVKFDLSGLVEFLMWLLIALGAAGLAYFGWRVWRGRTAPAAVAASAMSTAPDLTADNTTADQLPDDGWLALARDLAERGEHRLALRALYLAALAALARRGLVRLERAKSNREYEAELRRRIRSVPGVADNLAEHFAGLGRGFERVWYGGRPITAEAFAEFTAGVEQLRAP